MLKTLFEPITLDGDECAFEKHKCDAQATCSNTIESYTCACNEGFSGNGKVCRGTVLHPNRKFAYYVDSPGNYRLLPELQDIHPCGECTSFS